MIKNISAWKISSLNEYSVQIRLGSNLGGFFYFRKKEDAYGRKSGSDVMLKIWEQLISQNGELFSDCGPFCMNGGCEEGKMTCGKCIPPKMSPTDIIQVDFPKLCEETILEEGEADEDSTD